MKLKKLLNVVFISEYIKLYDELDELIFEGIVSEVWKWINEMEHDKGKRIKNSIVHNIEVGVNEYTRGRMDIWINYIEAKEYK